MENITYTQHTWGINDACIAGPDFVLVRTYVPCIIACGGWMRRRVYKRVPNTCAGFEEVVYPAAVVKEKKEKTERV